jgi:hypothetical protein
MKHFSILNLTVLFLAGVNAQNGIIASIDYSCSGQQYDVPTASGCVSFNAQINTFFVGTTFSESCLGIWFPKKNCQGAGLAGFDAQSRGQCKGVNGALSVQFTC